MISESMRERLWAMTEDAMKAFLSGSREASELDVHIYLSLCFSGLVSKRRKIVERNSERVRKLALSCSHEDLSRRFARLWMQSHDMQLDDAIISAVLRYLSEQRYGLMKKVLTDVDARRRGAREKLKNDPKQRAKDNVRKKWLAWHAGKTRYRSVAAFAVAVMKEHDCLESQPVIERWVRQWKAEAATRK